MLPQWFEVRYDPRIQHITGGATLDFSTVDALFGRYLVGPLAEVLFFDLAFWTDAVKIPVVVAWLAFGAIFLTVRMRFVNLRAFRHAVEVTAGHYDNPRDAGEVSHFQALAAALSATVGLGNIAGVAIAMSIGGPGATFWMIVAGFLGMTSKFAECTLGQRYRHVRPDGHVMGGAMYYLSQGLERRGLPRLGKALAVTFAVLCIGAALGGGNSFQVSQSLGAIQEVAPVFRDAPWLYGAAMVVLTGLVIIGGIKRIAHVASAIVPIMGIGYSLTCLFVLLSNWERVPGAVGQILGGAFGVEAMAGGVIGTIVIGFQRAAFSNEAGVGSAAIAHAAARTPYPVREGIVALLEPFIDTIVICTMTALAIVITGAWENPAYADLRAASNGAGLTSAALGEVISWFPYALAVAVFLFAYSTMLSWYYYGDRCWTWLFGEKRILVFRLIFLGSAFLGSVLTANNVLAFGDLMILAMAFPNLVGVLLLSGEVREELDSYLAKLRAGELTRYRFWSASSSARPAAERAR